MWSAGRRGGGGAVSFSTLIPSRRDDGHNMGGWTQTFDSSSFAITRGT